VETKDERKKKKTPNDEKTKQMTTKKINTPMKYTEGEKKGENLEKIMYNFISFSYNVQHFHKVI